MSPEDTGRMMGQNCPGETGPPRGGVLEGWASGVQGEKSGIKGGQSPQDE